jgi:glycine/D-amino acid oxidase-like deaminating enzyme/nitrite reductase/ring-hydroxylating ferredoxin subunit
MDAHDTERNRPPPGEAASIWLETTPETDYGALEGDLTVDTAVVGGGIAGLTTASKLESAGQSVAVLERDRIVAGVTGRTTAKLTSQHGLLYDHLLDAVGEAKARQYAEANEWAIDDVASTAAERGIDCEFERAPAYTYARPGEDRERIRAEVEAARTLGLPASYTESAPFPDEVAAAARFDEQAHFNPRKYLLGLAADLDGGGSHVFEETTARDIEDGEPCRVTTDRGTVTARDVVVATHFPFFDHALYFSRLSPKRSYVLAARLNGDVPAGMYYHDGEPYFSLRPHPTGDESLVLVGGQNHRTGQGGDTTERYRALEAQARDRLDVASIEYRWATQDYTSVDRVPFVGAHAPQVDHVHVATGFGGWGMTNGTAAGRILADRILDRSNPWRAVYRPTRARPSAAKDLLSHNADAMKHFVSDHLAARLGSGADADADAVAAGEATVVDSEEGPLGLYRDEDGELHAVSAVCTHLDCLVRWNDAERSWDCPCHGSRFDYDGTVLDTPAVEDLPTRDPDSLDR